MIRVRCTTRIYACVYYVYTYVSIRSLARPRGFARKRAKNKWEFEMWRIARASRANESRVTRPRVIVGIYKRGNNESALRSARRSSALHFSADAGARTRSLHKRVERVECCPMV